MPPPDRMASGSTPSPRSLRPSACTALPCTTTSRRRTDDGRRPVGCAPARWAGRPPRAAPPQHRHRRGDRAACRRRRPGRAPARRALPATTPSPGPPPLPAQSRCSDPIQTLVPSDLRQSDSMRRRQIKPPRHCQEQVRIQPLPVSVAERMGSSGQQARSWSHRPGSGSLRVRRAPGRAGGGRAPAWHGRTSEGHWQQTWPIASACFLALAGCGNRGLSSHTHTPRAARVHCS